MQMIPFPFQPIGFVVLIAAIFVFVFSKLLQYLWNITMPEVFALKPLTFWQAFRLLVIAFILFGWPSLFFH